ncbi:MAG: hypothetical protein AAF791_04560 [Bacteroidota bacterium]
MKRPGPIPRRTPLGRTAPLGRHTPIARKTPMKRGGPIQRTAPIKPRTRSASERARIYGTPARIAWMKTLRCVVPGCTETYCDIAHVRSGGMGRKAGASLTVPLCGAHHAEQHQGTRSFERRHGIDLAALAAETDEAWRAHAST